MLRCAESWFSKGIFRANIGKRKRLIGCIWQNVHIALVPAKSAFTVELDVDIFFLHAQMCLCWCAFGSVFLMKSLKLLKNEVSIVTRCLSIPCSMVPWEGFLCMMILIGD